MVPMHAVPWAPGLTTDPTVRRLRDDACRILASGGVWAADAVADELRVAWGVDTPPAEWLAAALAEDPRLWRFPDGRWLHLHATVDDRWFTVHPAPSFRRMGILSGDADLVTALTPFASWTRIPVTSGGVRGLLEHVGAGGVDGIAGRLLVCPLSLVPAAAGLLAVSPGPEGLRWHPVIEAMDEMADRRYRRAMARQLREHPAVPGGPPHSGSLPRRWTVVDVELLVLAADATARRTAVTPTSIAVAEEQAQAPPRTLRTAP